MQVCLPAGARRSNVLHSWVVGRPEATELRAALEAALSSRDVIDMSLRYARDREEVGHHTLVSLDGDSDEGGAMAATTSTSTSTIRRCAGAHHLIHPRR